MNIKPTQVRICCDELEDVCREAIRKHVGARFEAAGKGAGTCYYLDAEMFEGEVARMANYFTPSVCLTASKPSLKE